MYRFAAAEPFTRCALPRELELRDFFVVRFDERVERFFELAVRALPRFDFARREERPGARVTLRKSA